MAVAQFSLQSAALKPSDIKTRLDVDISTVYRWIRTGELPSIEIAGAKYVLVTAYERFLERKKGVTLEEQAQRHIGEGFEEEVDAAFDSLEGLELPIQREPHGTGSEPASPQEAIEAARAQFHDQLEALESRFGVPSERIHRLYFVEHEPHVQGIPDDLYAQWASLYAAYRELSLVPAR